MKLLTTLLKKAKFSKKKKNRLVLMLESTKLVCSEVSFGCDLNICLAEVLWFQFMPIVLRKGKSRSIGFHLSYCDCYFMSSSFNTGLLSQQGCMRDTEASCCTGS